eukprot:gene6394-10401_t
MEIEEFDTELDLAEKEEEIETKPESLKRPLEDANKEKSKKKKKKFETSTMDENNISKIPIEWNGIKENRMIKIAPRSKEELEEMRKNILEELDNDHVLTNQWNRLMNKKYYTIYDRTRPKTMNTESIGKRELNLTLKKDNPHLNKIHSKQVKPITTNLKSNDDIVKAENPSSFVTNVIQKVFRVSPKYTEPKEISLGTVSNVHYYECTAQVFNQDTNISEKASGKNKKESKTNA